MVRPSKSNKQNNTIKYYESTRMSVQIEETIFCKFIIKVNKGRRSLVASKAWGKGKEGDHQLCDGKSHPP